eukprot:1152123-Pelagomonas_calceolata.AAC.2
MMYSGAVLHHAAVAVDVFVGAESAEVPPEGLPCAFGEPVHIVLCVSSIYGCCECRGAFSGAAISSFDARAPAFVVVKHHRGARTRGSGASWGRLYLHVTSSPLWRHAPSSGVRLEHVSYYKA